MNKHLYRTVFSHRRGMRMAVAEHIRASGKAGAGEGQATAAAPRSARMLGVVGAVLALAAPPLLAQTRPPMVFANKLAAPQAPLPVPYGSKAGTTARPFVYDPARGAAGGDLAASGQVRWQVNGNQATFDQGNQDRVVINWDSFDIGAGYQVHFTQNKDPSRYVSALNRIWSADPSVILGSLTADREVILLNANGVYFGRGATVDTGKFVASTLSIADSVFEKGLRNVTDGSAVFTTAGTNYLPTNLDAGISIEAGAELRSAAGGDVLLFAPRIVNAGRIQTNQGQAVLAAGDKVYLMSSSDPKQRGLIVAVDPVLAGGVPDPELGTVVNAAQGSYQATDKTGNLVQRLNEIRAESGSVNLVGLTVRQAGQINATTAVKGANGAIYLQAMASTAALQGGPEATLDASRRGLVLEAGARARVGAELGTVEIAAGSVTAVTPDAGNATQLDAEVFNPSVIRVEGASIHVAGGARIEAAGGSIALLAATNSLASPLFDSAATLAATADGSRIVIGPDARISVAGLRDVQIDGARNQGAQRLFRAELADAPVQRDGPLYRQQVFFDLREIDKIALANLSGAAASITRTAREHATAGGTLRIEAEGAVVVGEDAMLDASGGSVRYSQATMKQTQLERSGHRFALDAVAATTRVDKVSNETLGWVSPAYVEGRDGGSLVISGRQMALAGTLAGNTIEGERQRDGRDSRAAVASLQVGRQVDSGFYLDAITLVNTKAPTTDAALAADPLRAPLDGLGDTTALSLPAITASGFGALSLAAQRITQPEFGTLDLGARGSLAMAADHLQLQGAFHSAGGTVRLATVRALADPASDVGDITLSAGTVLDVAGLWTNDTHIAATGRPATLQTDGGEITVTAARSLTLQEGTQLDVSGGARLVSSGARSTGEAGAITLRAGRSALFDSTLDIAGATLRGVDFAQGGSLTLGAPELTLATSGTPDIEGFRLAPEFFSAGGFGSIRVEAFGDVRVASGTLLAPVLRNWEFVASAPSAASGRMGDAVAVAQVLDPQRVARRAVDVALSAERTLQPSAGLQGGNLVVERGAAIALEPGATLALAATRDLRVGTEGGTAGQAATLSAPGGEIRLGIVGQRGAAGASQATEDVGFIASQALWLGADAILNVSGTAQLRPDTSAPMLGMGAVQFDGATPATATPATPQGERRTGTVYGGGSIRLEAQRGYVVAEAGSRLSLDGAVAALNLPGLAAPVQVARAAGTLVVSSPEGFALEGQVSAQAPRDAQGRALADGGRLELSVGRGGVNFYTAGAPYPGASADAQGNPLPNATPKPRTLQVGTERQLLAESGAQVGDNLQQALNNGIGYVPLPLLAQSGFDALRLAAGDALHFNTSLALALPLSITLDAPALSARAGTQVQLSAARIALGDSTLARIGTPPDMRAVADASAARDTTLLLQAPDIEVLGNLGLQGFSQVALDAGLTRAGTVRLGAPEATNLSLATPPQWTLNFAGELAITAGQIHATTGTQYRVQGLAATGTDDPGSLLTLRTAAQGAATNGPLSVFGTFTATATDIVQGGVLRQPFGAIHLDATRSLTLEAGSITSVSADGATLLYGQTENLSQWLTGNDFATTLPIAKGVRLTAPQLHTVPGAVVDASGGGDLLAWEFFPGVGGSRDYLATEGLYAVLPGHAHSAASAFAGGPLPAALQGRELVITMDGGDLPRGSYTLLPARYALLAGSLPQGAFLVRRAEDQGRTVLRAPLVQDDGAVVVTGYVREAGSQHTGTPGERFVIEPPSTFLAKSEYRLSSVSTLLATVAANRGAASAPALPRDGGQVQVERSGSDTTTWQAAVRLQAHGGRAGLLDFSAEQLALVDDPASTPDGALGVSAQVIADSGAGSVLLGGRRSLQGVADDGAELWHIDQSGTRALQVALGSRALAVEELVLAARDSIELAAGTQLAATATGTLGASRLASSGDGALLVVSANAVQTLREGATLAQGTLTVGAGSTLSGTQLALDATGALHIDPGTALRATALELGARSIVVGDAATVDPLATALTGPLLATVRAAPVLGLRGYTRIDFAGLQDWAQRADGNPTVVQQQLVLDAPALRGVAGADGAAPVTDIAALAVTLRNTSGLQAPALDPGAGSLTLQALPPLRYGHTGGITVGPGNVALAYGAAQLRSTGDIVLEGSGGLQAQHDLLLSAARLTATSGAEQLLTADAGTLRIAQEAGSRSLGERVGAGASLRMQGSTVQQDGHIALAGGNLDIQATGTGADATALRFGAGSTTSVAGFELTGSDGFAAFGHAGRIQARADQGRMELAGTLDASPARRANGSRGEGDAGSITLQAAGAGGQLAVATTAALQAHAGSGATDQGGRLQVDATTMASADELAQAAGQGGMDGAFSLRVREGDLRLDTDLRARRIALSADQGDLRIGAVRLDASAPSGGVVQLAAGRDMVLENGAAIDARSQRAGANGGDVLLASTQGRVSIAPGATIDATGDDAQDGRIVLRALRGADNRSVHVDPLHAANLRAAEVDIEAVRVYSTVGTGAGTRAITTIAATTNTASGTLGQATLRTDNTAFMNAAGGVLGALGVATEDQDRVHLRAGVEVRAAGHLTVSADWQLNNDRPGGDAGFLTLRAAGNLVINGSISDGFANATATAALNNNARSWSYRLAAGADLGAADVLAVRDLAAGDTETGNLSVASAKMVRTGAGSIEMAAGRDIRFLGTGSGTNVPGVAYVAGRRMEGADDILAELFPRQTAKPQFTEQGGRLELSAARDITAPEATQFINNWFWRTGLQNTTTPDQYATSSQLAWWSEFSRFRQTLGSFGGGDLFVEAGRDILNLQAMAPTAGWANSVVRSEAEVQTLNGGDLTVRAGGDIRGGQYLLGRGEGRLQAGGAIGELESNDRLQAPALALMNGQWTLAARTDVATTGAANPTALPASSADGRVTLSGLYYSWDGAAALRIVANAGDVQLLGMDASRVGGYGIGQAGPLGTLDVYARVLPTSLHITAAHGDIDLFTRHISGGLLFPSATGQLALWSGGDITLGTSSLENTLAMADSALAPWPLFDRPAGPNAGVLGGISGLIATTLAGQTTQAGLHGGDGEPVRIHAEGSLQTAGTSTLRLAKQARIWAGEDIRNLRLVGQNLTASDVTTITAGRNFLAGREGSITLGGPGALEITAGREVDLDASAGIRTIGNQSNPNLPTQGASVRVQAAATGVLDPQAFEAAFLRSTGSPRWQQYREALAAYVAEALGLQGLGFAQAWQYFLAFPAEAQAALGRRLQAAEFGAVYLAQTIPDPTRLTDDQRKALDKQMHEDLRVAFETHKSHLLQAGAAALASGAALDLPGGETLSGSALSTYLGQLQGLGFASLDTAKWVAARVRSRGAMAAGWRSLVATGLGGTVAGFEALAAQDPQAPALLAYQASLQDFSGRRFETYRDQVLAAETASAGTAAAQFGRLALPMRMALYDHGFQVAELVGVGSFAPQPAWAGPAPVFTHAGTLAMTQSSILTERGGGIALLNAGGAINVGLKDTAGGNANTPKGVIALGGGNIFGYAQGDFQVNTQRVFIVGAGNMDIWSSMGDIDSGRGANTAVAAPPLAARRSADGVVFEVPATTTGSGLGILEDANGRRDGSIGLYPAFGEILALDAFIRAPSVVLGSTIQGADNLQAAAVGGAAAAVAAPAIAAPPPPPASTAAESRVADTTGSRNSEQATQRSALLTVDLLGLGPEECGDGGGSAGRCAAPAAGNP